MKDNIVFLVVSGLLIAGLIVAFNVQQVHYQTREVTPPPPKTVYEQASDATGCPVSVLRGISLAESSLGRNVHHASATTIGEFGLDERWHDDRAHRYGEYNPACTLEAAVIVGRMYVDNLAFFGDSARAIAAHRQGRTGVLRDGPSFGYVARVMEAAR